MVSTIIRIISNQFFTKKSYSNMSKGFFLLYDTDFRKFVSNTLCIFKRG